MASRTKWQEHAYSDSRIGWIDCLFNFYFGVLKTLHAPRVAHFKFDRNGFYAGSRFDGEIGLNPSDRVACYHGGSRFVAISDRIRIRRNSTIHESDKGERIARFDGVGLG